MAPVRRRRSPPRPKPSDGPGTLAAMTRIGDTGDPVHVVVDSGGGTGASEATLAEISARLGDDVASPAANTLGARLKALVDVLTPPTTGGVGRKVVAAAGTDEALAASTVCRWVIVTAETDNTGLISVGPGAVAAEATAQTGTILAAGDSAMFPVGNLSLLRVDATVTGDGVAYSYGI